MTSKVVVPGSPKPHHKESLGIGQVASEAEGTNNGSGSWKVAVNNGTDLCEASLRGGAPPPQPITQKVPREHTPTTNHGKFIQSHVIISVSARMMIQTRGLILFSILRWYVRRGG